MWWSMWQKFGLRLDFENEFIFVLNQVLNFDLIFDLAKTD